MRRSSVPEPPIGANWSNGAECTAKELIGKSPIRLVPAWPLRAMPQSSKRARFVAQGSRNAIILRRSAMNDINSAAQRSLQAPEDSYRILPRADQVFERLFRT